ncbi:hypothetical protein GCM10011575_47380 [Microlunatus endophyticus]|uniref:Alpha/beta hydrolase fold-3 domain-containing protein n=1 Tax=Microlunatus endophyticus TaxID=1716077 RepID=A0A917SK81_9ACTN|nr:alpha/beta hydrolase [Microlunatus endophyticus]GGL83564.1 hypothetical protein GCM10011575_47380 [Microlunatus endophyticus]
MVEFERPSLRARLMPAVQRLRHANEHYLSTDNLHRHLQQLTAHPRPVAPPGTLRRGVSITATSEQGWRVYTVSPTGTHARGTVIYLHGGGWIHEAGRTHWRWVQQVADEASTTVIVPVYPLAHEGGTAAEVVPIVAGICEQASGPVVVMGDSAGGTIAMSATLLLRQRQKPPALTVLISPVLDLSLANPEIDRVQARDPWLAKPGLQAIVEMWAGGHLEDPDLNPIHADLQGLPPLMIFSGTRDILNPDTQLFVDRAITAGVEVGYTELREQIHAFPLLPTPEGKRARSDIIAAVRRVIAGKSHPFSREPRIGRYPAHVKSALRRAETVLPRSGSIDEMLALLSAIRGRPISLLTEDLNQSVSGLLLSTDQADYIAVPAKASPERLCAIVCHEVAHALLGHDHSKPLIRSLMDSGLLPGINEDFARSIVAARYVYMDPSEVDAEIVATFLAKELRRRVLRGGDTFYEDRWR